MKLRFQPRDDVSQRVRTAAGLTVRLAGTTDALRFALAAGDDEAQRWLGWNPSQLVPIESQRHARRQTRGAASGPPLEGGSGSTLLAALVGEDYVGGVQLSPVTPVGSASGGLRRWRCGSGVRRQRAGRRPLS